MSAAPPTMPRLFAAGPTLAENRACFGELPEFIGPELISQLEQAGLSGRGGAGFPTPRKLAAIHGAKPVVIGNGAEGEPLSHKDASLISRAPHLVLDGLQAAAEVVNAHKVYLYLHQDAVPAAEKALDERRAAGIDQHDAHSAPLVDGRVSPWRAKAWRSSATSVTC